MNLRAVRYLSAHKLLLPAGMTYEDSSSYPSQGGENRVERGVGYVEPCFTEDAIYFHINDVVSVRILPGLLVSSQVFTAFCHAFLSCASRSGALDGEPLARVNEKLFPRRPDLCFLPRSFLPSPLPVACRSPGQVRFQAAHSPPRLVVV